MEQGGKTDWIKQERGTLGASLSEAREGDVWGLVKYWASLSKKLGGRGLGPNCKKRGGKGEGEYGNGQFNATVGESWNYEGQR